MEVSSEAESPSEEEPLLKKMKLSTPLVNKLTLKEIENSEDELPEDVSNKEADEGTQDNSKEEADKTDSGETAEIVETLKELSHGK